jgi:hypothetical protein
VTISPRRHAGKNVEPSRQTGGPAAAHLCVLSAPEVAWLGALVDAIIPRTATPGASDAGVPAFIHGALAQAPMGAETFRAGMAALDAVSCERSGGGFADLGEDEKLNVLSAVAAGADSECRQFVLAIKRQTVIGYYLSREGLCQELGWRPPSARGRLRGCVHPEHRG